MEKGVDKLYEDLIIYIDDDENKKTVYAYILEETNSTILFQPSNSHKIRMPWTRILKIKYNKKGDGYD